MSSHSAARRGDDLQCLPQRQSVSSLSGKAWRKLAVTPSAVKHGGELQGLPQQQGVGTTCSVSLGGRAPAEHEGVLPLNINYCMRA